MKFVLMIPLLILVCASSAGAAVTVDNDDSCDIAVLPAATLLLPYFEVDLESPAGETTLFTVTNVTNFDQIAHVTLWTDYGFPVINFNIYLTGYDVQAINLYDIVVRGVIAPDAGTGTAVTKRGTYSDVNRSLNVTACDRLPGALDPIYLTRMQQAFTLGRVPNLGILEGCANIGGAHDHAIGYATIDVVGTCNTHQATDAAYWTEDIRYENVLIGDYQQINNAQNFAQGSSMVHLRAIPEGGTPAARAMQVSSVSGFDQTFYGRYQAPGTPKLDGRQPLPSSFATRWIQGGSSSFQTSMKVWREGRTDSDETCARYGFEAHRKATEIVVFDENENAVSVAAASGEGGLILRPELPSTSRTEVSDSDIYPQIGNGSHAGWMYFNLDHTRGDTLASQNWIVSSMRAEGRYSTDIDAVALGNGCSSPLETTAITATGGPAIQPAPNEARSSTGVASANNDDSCDIALLPAATLLLPYFQVNLENPAGETTLFTVANVSPSDQIARVTLWTDGAYPVLTFNIYLTGYDVQAINLYDILARGVIASSAGTGTRVTARGPHSERNAAIDVSDCHNLPGSLDAATVTRLQAAFTLGKIPNGCNLVGWQHDDAVGYATVDLVRTCSGNGPTDAAYWTDDLMYDNVLIGDVQQINGQQNFAQGSTLVHIRAIPEGGTFATRPASPFTRTFYGHYQAAATPQRDGRQPLPATFAARWIQGGASGFQTSYKVWREAKTGIGSTCAQYAGNSTLSLVEVVRFDEAENAVGDVPTSRVCTPIYYDTTTSATSLTSVTDTSIYPQLTNGAVAGWMYLNIDNCDRDLTGSSNWVVTSMRSEGRFSADMDAAALGNGCSAPAEPSEVTIGTAIIGPARNTR
ncbi:MAG: hypothetical protein ABI779_13575 [Acidobacteriota bacterium]